MGGSYEQIHYGKNLPVKMFTHTVRRFPYHWHEDIEIIFVLSGEVEVRVHEKKFSLGEGDLFLINSNELHFLMNKGAWDSQVLVLQIDRHHLYGYDIDVSYDRFHLNSAEKDLPSHVFLQIKNLLAKMMDTYLNEQSNYKLKLEQELLQLIIILLEYCRVEGVRSSSDELRERIIEIISFLNQNYANPKLTITRIAEEFDLHPQYLSRYFREQTGYTLKKLLDYIRLNYSLRDLHESKETIANISLAYGFPDSKSYYRTFKEVMGMTPLAYRKRIAVPVEETDEEHYLHMNSKAALKKLFQYSQLEEYDLPFINEDVEVLTVDGKQTKERLEKGFTRLLTFGYAPHALRGDFLEQLEIIQEEIGFSYVRFHGIFSDELKVYRRTETGEEIINFDQVTMLLNSLLDRGLKPFLELGFMPKDLAKTKDKIFNYEAYVSPPKSMESWQNFLRQFFLHLINTYGRREIRSWYFEFWNEPEITGYFWSGTREEFFHFFEASYDVIKGIDPKIRLGGFGNVNILQDDGWLQDCNEYMEKRNLSLDFFSFHTYNLESKKRIELPSLEYYLEEAVTQGNFARSLRLSYGDEDYLGTLIDNILVRTEKLSKFREIPHWITEWNGNTDPEDLLHDTCYMASFIVKQSLENKEKVEGMGYWTFTDIFDEFPVNKTSFHGGFGLFTEEGIKKPSYHALNFLSKLGENVVEQGRDYIITRSGDDFFILLHNYSHPNKLYSSFDYSQLTKTNRTAVFDKKKERNYEIRIENLVGCYEIKKQAVNREEGSSYDAWVDMGAPEELDKDMIQFLQSKAEPFLTVERRKIAGRLKLRTRLLPHEIQLYSIKKRYKS